uniref:Uncharacterized protein n=1 Tax=Anopheles atroparvus TaxID=41427 RepID=A0AAG5DCT5_ANOAO
MRTKVQDWMTTVGAIVGAIVVWQSPLVAGGPNYGLANDVPGSLRVAAGNDRVSSYLPSFAADQLSTATLTQTAFGLPTILALLKQTGTHVSEAGLSGTGALSALIAGNSGSSGVLFDSVLQSVDAQLEHLGQHLPTTKDTLKTLIGDNLPDRLADGFDRIASGLTRLRSLLVALQNAIGAAVAEAGSESAIPTATLQRYVTLPLVYNLAEAVHDLRAYLPVVRYTLTTSIEDVLTAAAFLAAYQTTVDSVETLVILFIDPLDTAREEFYNRLTHPKTGVAGLEDAFSTVQQDTELLAMIAVPARKTVIDAMLSPFALALNNVDADLAAVETKLQNYMEYVEQLLAITDTELVSIDDSQLIGALVHTLIDCGRYARYCFHKYQHLVGELIDALLLRTSGCVEREVLRLTNLGTAASSLLMSTAYDIADMGDMLFICDAIQDATDQAQCVTTISDSIKPLGALFADKYDLLYDLADTELAASKQRIKMCVELSDRMFSERYIPDLRSEIESCATDGPNAT